MDTEQTQEVQQPEKKEERVDELDIVGGLLIKLAKSFVTFYRKFFKSQQQS